MLVLFAALAVVAGVTKIDKERVAASVPCTAQARAAALVPVERHQQHGSSGSCSDGGGDGDDGDSGCVSDGAPWNAFVLPAQSASPDSGPAEVFIQRCPKATKFCRPERGQRIVRRGLENRS